MFADAEQHPYLFCYRCDKLSPIKNYGDKTKYGTCKICLTEIKIHRNRLVFLSKEEAEVRGLYSPLKG